jgi:hypothetical protein
MEELSVDLEVIIINLISQNQLSIWLYDDGRTVVASTPPGRLSPNQAQVASPMVSGEWMAPVRLVWVPPRHRRW